MHTNMDEQLARYLPDLILNRLSRSDWNRQYPLMEPGQGSVMLVDISGFTPLTKMWIRRGAAGLEQLTVILNTYFDPMIDAITGSGGQAVSFAGDALLAIWPVSAGEDVAATLPQAVSCGLRLQEMLHDKELIPGIRLSLRIAVSAGDYGVYYVGGVRGRWELVLAGEAVDRLSACAGSSEKGRVLLAPEAYRLSPGLWEGAELTPDGGGYRIPELHHPQPVSRPEPGERVRVQREALLPYLPPTVLSAVAEGNNAWAAELRSVTVLFVRLPDFPSANRLDSLHEAVETVQHSILAKDGILNKISLDEKGIAAIAAWGLPSATHEDDAARALLTGLSLHKRLTDRGMPVSVGISTGVVFCGSIGGELRQEYTMIGETMNLAARLMQKADGGILCDETTYKAAAGRADFETLAPLELKGFEAPVPVYRPLENHDPTPAVSQAKSLIGRKKEREALKMCLDELHAGTGGAILLRGEAGMGKSRLIVYAREEAEALDIRILSGSGDTIEKLTPYFPWRPIFRSCFGADPASGRLQPEAVVEKARRLLPSKEHLLPLLNAVLPLDLEDNEWTRHMTGRIRAENTQSYLAELLQAHLAGSPSFVILDDVHWMDSASWALLADAVKRLPEVLFLAAMRPDAGSLPAEHQLFANSPGTRILDLQQLSQEDTLQLICERLGVSSLPPEVRKLILSKTEGHPFFTEELTYALRDRGFLQIENGECRLVQQESGSLQDILFRPTIQGIVMSRIDRLPPKDQLVLKTASVIGRLFTYSTLIGILPFQTESRQFADQLAALEAVNLTVLESVRPDLTYLFRHIITQEVTYNMLLQSQRRQLHQAAAEWLERQYPDPSPIYSMLAHHWRKAENPAKAIHYLEKVGQQALRTGAYAEAVYAYTDILELLPKEASSGEKAVWHTFLGEAYMGIGDMSLAKEQLWTALALYGSPQPSGPKPFKRQLMRQVMKQLLHRVLPRRMYSGVKKGRPEIVEQARCYFRLSEIAFFTNEPMDNIYNSLHGLNLGEEAGPSVTLAQILGNMCVTAGIMAIHPLARAYKKQAKLVADHVKEPLATAWVAMDFSLYHIGIGDWEEAARYAREGMELYEKMGDKRYWEACSYLYVKVLSYRDGDYEASSRLAAAIYASGKQSGNAQAQSWGLLAQAENRLNAGMLGEALELLQEAEALIPSHIGLTEEIRVYAQLGLAHWRQGDRQQAHDYASRALTLIGQSSPTAYYAYEGYAAVVEVFLSLWEEEAAAAGRHELSPQLRQALDALAAFAKIFPIAKPRLELYRGRIALRNGPSGSAAKHGRKGLNLAVKLEMPYEEVRLAEELAVLSPQGPMDHAAYTDRARELKDRMGSGM